MRDVSIHCNDQTQSTMSISLYRKIIDAASHFGITEVSSTGLGEPLLDEFLLQRNEHAKSRGMRVGFPCAAGRGGLLLCLCQVRLL